MKVILSILSLAAYLISGSIARAQTFTDINAAITGIQQGSVIWGDYDGDNDLDCFVVGTEGVELNYISGLYQNNSGVFSLLDNELKNIATTNTNASWGDYDNDGDIDLIVDSKIYQNEAGVFTNINANLTTLEQGSVSWGDYDNDNDLDLLITGTGGSAPGYQSIVYRNDNGSFVDIGAGLPGIWAGSGEWGDFDDDGDLDILLVGKTGNSGEPNIGKIYRNSSNTFAELLSFDGIGHGAASWGDYDNDDDLDVLLSGNLNSSGSTLHHTKLYKNENNTLVDSGVDLPNLAESYIGWVDFDSDGNLDLMLTGQNESGNPDTELYRNTGIADFELVTTGIVNVQQGSFDWGDYDGDGTADLVISGDDAGTFTTKIYKAIDATDIVSFTLAEQLEPAIIDNVDHRVIITISDADRTTLIPSFTLPEGATALINSEIQVSGVTANDYSSPVTMTIRAEDGIAEQEWTIYVLFDVPRIFSLTPSSGPVGTSVTIAGANFDSTPENNIVFFGATQASVSSASSTELTVTVPGGATYQSLSVVSNGLIAHSRRPFLASFGGDGIDSNSFFEKEDFSTNVQPHLVSLADFDGDGLADVAIGIEDDRIVSVYRNTSTGFNNLSFASKVDFFSSSSQSSITTGDLNGDGKIDMIVTNWSTSNISIFRNTSTGAGDISFGVAQQFDVGGNPESVCLADLDLDGKLDITVANGQDNTFSVLENTTSGTGGTITLEAKVDFATGSEPRSIFATHFDNDELIDLVVANYDDNSISVYKNSSTGVSINFDTRVDFNTQVRPISVRAGFFDDDDLADIVAVNEGSYSLSVFRNESSGSGTIDFGTSTDLVVNETPVDASFADLDGDGRLDLVGVSKPTCSLSLYEKSNSGIGSIEFNQLIDYTTGRLPGSVAVGDINGDNKPDIVVPNSQDNNFSVFENSIQEPQTRIIRLEGDMDFGEVPLNTTSSRTLTIHNDGNSTLTLQSLSFNAVPEYTSDDSTPVINLQLAPLTSTDVIINFTPTAVINWSTTLDVSSDKTDGINTIELSGVGIEPIPSITSFTPTSGPVGTTVTISGDNFHSTPENNIVFFGATQASVSSASATELTVTVPVGATYEPISVLVAGLQAYSQIPFLVAFGGSEIDTDAFGSKMDFNTGSLPESVCIGDFDGDGNADLAVANISSNTISVFRNVSSGIGNIGLDAKIDLQTGAGPYSVISSDLDNDGKEELVVANYDSGNGNSLSIFRNTSSNPGSIAFASRIEVTTGLRPRHVAAGDLDHDGKIDLVVANATDNTISLLRNTSVSGSLSFEDKVDFATGNQPWSVAVGDLDDDNKNDVIVTNSNSNNISVFRNESSGAGTISLATSQEFESGLAPVFVSLGDLDGDAKLDLAVTNWNSNFVSVFRNATETTGLIALEDHRVFGTGTFPESGKIGDVDGDGKADLLVANSDGTSGNTVSVLRNSSSGVGNIGFLSRVDFNTNSAPRGLAFGDLDNDGKGDLVVVNNGDNTVSILRNGVSTSTSPSIPVITSFTPTSGPVGTTVTITGENFNSTPENNTVFFGAAQAVVSAASATELTVTVPSGATYEPISILAGGLIASSRRPFLVSFGGEGIDANSFEDRVDFSTTPEPHQVSLADFDGDGLTDVVIALTETGLLSVFRNTSSGFSNLGFATKVDYTPGSFPTSIATGDLNGDGKIDMVVTNLFSNTVAVFRNTSSGVGVVSFAPRMEFAVGESPESACLFDFDLDGKLDIAVANKDGNTFSILQNTNSDINSVSFASKVDFATGSEPFSIFPAHFDDDGLADLVVANYTGNSISVYRNISVGNSISFDTRVDFNAQVRPISVTAGYFDDDDLADIVVVNQGSNSLSVFRNESSESDPIDFGVRMDLAVDEGPIDAAIGDLDGDGRLDLVGKSQTAGSISIFEKSNSGIGTIEFNQRINFTTGNTPSSVAVGDLNGDNKPDIIVPNWQSSNFSIFENSIESSTSTPADGLIAYYPFNGNASDESENNFDGTVSGAALTSDRFGNQNRAYDFDGIDDFIETSSEIDQNFVNGVTFSVWIKPTQVGSDPMTFISNFNGQGTSGNCAERIGFQMRIQPDGSLRINYSVDSDDFIAVSTDPNVVVTDSWQHVVFTWNGSLSGASTNNFGIYLNGQELSTSADDSGSVSCASQLVESLDPFRFGSHECASGSCHMFQGAIDDVRFYNRILTDQEINDLLGEGGWIVNTGPTAIDLSNNSISENEPINSTIGSFSTIDPNSADAHTYSLVTGIGDTDNSSFDIVNTNQLVNKEVFDFETKSTYSIRVQTDDGNGGTFSNSFAINVIDVDEGSGNSAPTDISLTNASIAENQSAGTQIGTFNTTDPDGGDSHTYSLISGSTTAFTIADGNSLESAQVFDASVQSSYNITIRTTDSGGLSFEKEFTITISPVNNSPTNIILSNNIFRSESATAGMVVGSFTTIDPDNNDTFTYSLVAGTGDNDNDRFSIAGSTLTLASEVNSGNYSVRVQSSDGMLTIARVFNITVVSVSTSSVLEPGSSISNYRIFGVPTNSIRINQLFPDLTSGSRGTSWRITTYSNGSTTDLNSSSPLAAGKGYWFLSTTNVVESSVSLPPVTMNSNSEFELNLTSGWNLISNPFYSELNIANAIAFNETQGIISSGDVTPAGVYTYNGSYNVSSGLRVFEGGWIFSSNPVTLRIPNPGASTGGRQVQNFESIEYSWFKDESNWQLLLEVRSGEMASNLPGIGVRTGALDEMDHFDLQAPPQISPDAAFSLGDVNGIARSFVSPGEEKKWTFGIDAPKHEKITVSWDPSIVKMLSKNLYLYVSELNLTYNMETISQLTVPTNSSLHITYGGDIDRSTLDFHVRAYPNPLDDKVSFEFFVEGPDTQYEVSVLIYGLDGKLVHVRSAFKPSNQPGVIHVPDLDLPSGLYLYRINYDNRSSQPEKLIIK